MNKGRKGKLFKKECIKCEKRFRPQTRSSKLCDDCHEFAQKHRNLKRKVT